MLYTFYNQGSISTFNPDKMIVVPTGRQTNLEFHLEIVRDAHRRDVYIMDNKGRELQVKVAA